MKKFYECALVTVCYWLTIFLGPAIVILWNNLSYFVSGLGYGEGSIMYKVLTFFSQPAACVLAFEVSKSVGKSKHNICTLINCFLGACFCGAVTMLYAFYLDDNLRLLTMAVSSVCCIFTVYVAAKEMEMHGEHFMSANKETRIPMRNAEKVFRGILITISIWTIARFVPGFIGTLWPDQVIMKLLAFIVMLPIGWLAAMAISNGALFGCVRANIYLFAIIEFFGIFDMISYIVRWYSSDYYLVADPNGIAFSDYPKIFTGLFLFEIVYLSICFFLAKKKTWQNKEDAAHAGEVSYIMEAKELAAIQKKNEEEKRLRSEIARKNEELKDLERKLADIEFKE